MPQIVLDAVMLLWHAWSSCTAFNINISTGVV
jgi:hypothetical protein